MTYLGLRRELEAVERQRQRHRRNHAVRAADHRAEHRRHVERQRVAGGEVPAREERQRIAVLVVVPRFEVQPSPIGRERRLDVIVIVGEEVGGRRRVERPRSRLCRRRRGRPQEDDERHDNGRTHAKPHEASADLGDAARQDTSSARQPAGRVAIEERERAVAVVGGVRERAVGAALEADLLQHALRDDVIEIGDAGDARQAEIDEPVPQQRLRPFPWRSRGPSTRGTGCSRPGRSSRPGCG